MDDIGDPGDPDTDFPSGQWTGLVQILGRAERIELHLTFACGQVAGIGIHRGGEFVLEGDYDPGTLEVRGVVTYPARRAVSFRGFRELHGIWGTWESGDGDGFHVWPRSVREEPPADRVTEPVVLPGAVPSWLFRI